MHDNTTEWWQPAMMTNHGYTFNIQTMEWKKISIPVEINRVYHQAFLLPNGNLCVAGGAKYVNGEIFAAFNNIISWDKTSSSCSLLNDKFPVWGFSLFDGLLVGKVVMVGGVTTHDQWNETTYTFDLKEKKLVTGAGIVKGECCGAVVSRNSTKTAVMIVERDEVVTIMEIIGDKEEASLQESGTEPTLDVDDLIVVSDKEESGEDSDESSQSQSDTGIQTTGEVSTSSHKDSSTSDPDENGWACSPCILERGRRGLEGKIDYSLIEVGQERSARCEGCGGLFHLLCEGFKMDPYKYKAPSQVFHSKYKCKKCRLSGDSWPRSGFKWLSPNV